MSFCPRRGATSAGSITSRSSRCPPGHGGLRARHSPGDVVRSRRRRCSSPANGLPPAIVNLLHEAARESHADQGYFEKPREFPNTDPSTSRCRGRGPPPPLRPSILHRYLPFFFATFDRAPRHPARAAAGGDRADRQPVAAARPLAHADRASIAGTASSRCSERDVASRNGRAADRRLARNARPDRGGRGAHQDARELCQRGLYAARAHRARPPSASWPRPTRGRGT
jgi:hypothetical protein